MKKRFWTRLISAVVTAAMAFSILAMPASAAEKSWAVGMPGFFLDATGENVQDGLIMLTPAAIRDELGDKCPEGTDEDLLVVLEEIIRSGELPEGIELPEEIELSEVKELLRKMVIFKGTIPEKAYFGFSNFDPSNPNASKDFWYDKQTYMQIASGTSETPKMDFETGTLTLGKEPIKALDRTQGTSSTPAANGSSSDVSVVAILAVGGAAVAAATGVYLYTHPEKVEEIKDFFADLGANVQAKVQEVTTNVKDAFQNILPDREAAETAETAPATEPVAETPAA